MYTNLDQLFYNVDYHYELKKWNEDNKFYLSSNLLDYGQGVIAGYSLCDVSFKQKTLTEKYGFISGNVYEKNVETNYDVQVNLKYNGSIVETKNTLTGAFKFTNLNPNVKYSLEFIDTTNKYNPKMLSNIQPDLDIDQDPKINIHSYPKVVGDTLRVYFDIVALGEYQVNLARAPTEFKIEKINETTYAVTGENRNRDIDFDILLDDFRETGLKSTSVNIKQDKRTMLDFKFNNSLTDTSGKYNLTKVGEPVLSSDHISIDGEVNTIKYEKTDINDDFTKGQTSFTVYLDLLYKGPKNTSSPSTTDKYIVASATANTARYLRLIIVDNKYLAMRFPRTGSSAYTGTYKFPISEMIANNRYRIKLISYVDQSTTTNRIQLFLNDKMIDGYIYNYNDSSLRPEILLSEFGAFLFGHLNNNDPNNHTLFDLYEFKFANYVF